jgi:GH15 family glucan-1,4-alpha-glucosidase
LTEPCATPEQISPEQQAVEQNLIDRVIASFDATPNSWQSTADKIREQILTKGWSDTVNSFTEAFGSDALDASALMIPLVGFLPADDPRVLATIDAIAEHLTDSRGLVYRYRTDLDQNVDGLTGEEGTFLLCTFWLAQALATSGQIARAREVFERAISYRNDVGLLSEEVERTTGELLGNFPQAFSHIGLVNAAWAIAQAEATHGSADRGLSLL